MEKDLAMYILINKDIELTKGKISGQAGHSILRYITSEKGREDENLQDFLNMDDNNRIIVSLECPESRLKTLENEGYPVQRDLGLTELPPDTLTMVCYGVVNRAESIEGGLNCTYRVSEVPGWLKRLRLYKK